MPAAESIPVDQVLRLSTLTPIPLIEADMDRSTAPDPCIVRQEGLIIGFHDAGMPDLVGSRPNIWRVLCWACMHAPMP